MVYKKFIRKNGKLHGPYYYESYRENGKIKHRYLGTKHPSHNKRVLMISAVVLVAMIVLSFAYMGITGRNVTEVLEEEDELPAEIPEVSEEEQIEDIDNGDEEEVVEEPVEEPGPESADPDSEPIELPDVEGEPEVEGEIVEDPIAPVEESNESGGSEPAEEVVEANVSEEEVVESNESVEEVNVTEEINETEVAEGNESVEEVNVTEEIVEINDSEVVVPEGNVTAEVPEIVVINDTNESVVSVPEVSNVSVNVVTTRSKIRIGQRVRWTKNVTLSAPENVTVELPEIAEEVVVKKFEDGIEQEAEVKVKTITGEVIGETDPDRVPPFVRWVRKFFGSFRAILTGFATLGDVSDGVVEVALEDEATDYIIEYYTEAPQAIEEATDFGKRVIITGPDDVLYEDVVAFTFIPETGGNIRMHWVESDLDVPFDAYDTDSNGLIDYVEWVVPHLSNQTYEIILITNAEHLDENRAFLEDVYNKVESRDGIFATIPKDHYLRVRFEDNLTSSNDITIFARSSDGGSVGVYEKNQEDLIANIGVIGEDKEYRTLLSNLVGKQDEFDLKVVGGTVEFDFILDPVPSISSMLLNASDSPLNTSDANLTLTITATDGDGDAFKNVTNWYVNNVSLMVLNMPMVDGTSNISHTKDYSNFSYNGTGEVTSFVSSGGHDGFGELVFNGSTDFINFGNDTGLNNLGRMTVAVWAKMNTTPGFLDIIAKKDDSAGAPGGWRIQTRTSGVASFDIDDGAGAIGTAIGSTNINDGKWYFLVGVLNGTDDASIYVNGVLDGVASGTSVSNFAGDYADTDGVIGRNPDGSRDWNGSISQVQVYNRALSNEQIVALYNNGTDLIVSQETNRGEVWVAEVTPNDGTGDGLTAQSNNLSIENIAPVAAGFGNITNPLNNSNQSGIGANITYVNWTSFFDSEGDSITYNVSLRDLDFSLNSTLNTSTTNLFTGINYSVENNGSFILMVEGCDTFGDCDNTTIFVNINNSEAGEEAEEETTSDGGDGEDTSEEGDGAQRTTPITEFPTIEFCYSEDISCSEWSSCVDGESTRSCSGNENCLINLDFLESVSCSCDPDYQCGSFGQCDYTDRVEDVITGDITLTGTRERTCVDNNGCAADFEESESCSSEFSIDISIVGDALTGTSDKGIPVLQINLSELEEGRFAVTFLQNDTVFPPHCYNAVRDRDENLVDCGGECRRCATDLVIPWILIVLIVLTLILIWLLGWYYKDNKKKVKKEIRELKDIKKAPIFKKLREDIGGTKKERAGFLARVRKLFSGFSIPRFKRRKRIEKVERESVKRVEEVAAAELPEEKRPSRRGRKVANAIVDGVLFVPRKVVSLTFSLRIKGLIKEGHKAMGSGNLKKARANYAKIRPMYDRLGITEKRKIRKRVLDYYNRVKHFIGNANEKINERNSREINDKIKDFLKKYKRFDPY